MNASFTYLLVNFGTILFPFLLSFDRKVAFFRQWRPLFLGLWPVAAFFIFWDVLFTRWGVWGFNKEFVSGCYLISLPIEEWAFFFTVPYSCFFIYECLRCYVPFERRKDYGWSLFPVAGSAFVMTAILNASRAYTVYAFLGSGLGLLLVWLFRKRLPAFRADAFWIMYFISIVPFLIVNGILTALPVVIYNDAENLGIRLFTIPFEDLFYGMLLMLGNVVMTELIRGRKMLPLRAHT